MAPGLRKKSSPRDLKNREVATHWQLMWWKFKRHKMALLGFSVLAVFIFISVFAEMLSPYTPHERNQDCLCGPPMGLHFFDADRKFHLRPFVYARASKRDPVTLRMLSQVDKSKRWPVRFFTRGTPYKFWGLFEWDIHLFSTKEGFIHLFGTDLMGRDLFSRCLYATRISLSIGIAGVVVSFVFGLIFGGIAGYMGGRVDNLIMRSIEFIRSIPTLPLWLALAASMPREWSALKVYVAITFILSFIGWTYLARRIRGKLLALREEDFVIAARLNGCSHARIIGRHLLPAFMSYIIVNLTISFPWMILAETSLSFLGLGLREPAVSWGVLLYSAQSVPVLAHMPWLLVPGLFVIIVVLAFNFVGDGLRDAADPYAK